jgi:diaminohydroxyphosphoribosylaminopyrimidine deaminase/5-amino-6-(5-phosphoribosylamino)uracil reductase
LFDGSAPAIVLTSKKKKGRNNLEYIQMDFSKDILDELMDELYKREVQSLIVEGGTQLLESFIGRDLWDEARVFTGNKKFYKGVNAPHFEFPPISEDFLDKDRLGFYRNFTFRQ